MNDQAKGITKTAAAVMLKCHPRTITRMVERSELTQLTSGKVSLAEVEQLKEAGVTEEDPAELRVRVLTETVEGLSKLVGTLVREVKTPLEVANKANKDVIKMLMKENRRHGATTLKTFGALGKVLMRKEERRTEREMSAARLKIMSDTFEDVRKAVPKLLDQMAGASDMKAFAKDLSDEDSASLWLLVDMFKEEGKKKQAKRLKSMLKAAGVRRANEENAEEKERPTEEQKPTDEQSSNEDNQKKETQEDDQQAT